MATVFSIVRKPDNTPFTGEVLFRLTTSPRPVTGGVFTASDVKATCDVTGFFTLTLAAGDYYVWVGASRRRKLTIPNDAASYLLEDLLGVTDGTAALNYRYLGDDHQLLNDLFGAFHTWWLTGSAGNETLALGEAGDAQAFKSYLWDGSTFWLWNPDQAAWHSPYISGATPQLAFTAAGVALAANARFYGGKFQLKNTTSGQWHTVFVTGAPGAEQFVIGAGES